MIRPARTSDAAGIARVYNHYVEHTIVTFEEVRVTADEMERRMDEVQRASLPWLVFDDGEILGHAYATPWKRRAAYRFAVETTVYVRHDATGKGIGSMLYDALFAALRSRGDIHAIIGGIALPNDASVALHEKFGMKKVAHFREVGFKLDRWIDVAYWESVL